MNNRDIVERELHPANGLAMLFLLVIATILSVCLFFVAAVVGYISGLLSVILIILGCIGCVVFPVMLAGLKTVQPNEARVLLLFGKYHGTIKKSGFYFVNPFCESFSPTYNAEKGSAAAKSNAAAKEGQTVIIPVSARKTISTKTQTLDNGRQKVNDVLGNPIIIGAIVIWQVDDPTKAAFAVENYREYLSIQTDSTIRNIARLYPYDLFDEDEDNDGLKEKTLRGSALEIAESMKTELQKRVEPAGLEVLEVRITHLAYAEEIAAAMLQRQQASAIIAARQKIVDGAVGMVKMAIDKLGEDEVVVLDEERKAAMVSNLLVVLCGNKDAQPIVNSGTIY